MVLMRNKGLTNEKRIEINSYTEGWSYEPASEKHTFLLTTVTPFSLNDDTMTEYCKDILNDNYQIKSVEITVDGALVLDSSLYNEVFECTTTVNNDPGLIPVKFGILKLINKEEFYNESSI